MRQLTHFRQFAIGLMALVWCSSVALAQHDAVAEPAAPHVLPVEGESGGIDHSEHPINAAESTAAMDEHGANVAHEAGEHGVDAQVAHWTDHHVFPDTYTDFHTWHVIPGVSLKLPTRQPATLPTDLDPVIVHHETAEPGEAKAEVTGLLTPFSVYGMLNVHGLMIVIAAALLLVLFLLLYDYKARVPSGLTNVLESMVKFIRDDIAVPNMGEHAGRAFTPLLCTFFFFILTMNVMGLVPIFSTATSNFSVTTGLATCVFLVMTVGAIVLVNPVNWIKSFMPHGVPWPVLIIILPLELAGLLIKTFALSVRLFANMMAGHIVLFSFIGLMAVYGAVAAPAFLLGLGVYALETFVALLQAYVFTMLSAIFIGHIMHPAH